MWVPSQGCDAPIHVAGKGVDLRAEGAMAAAISVTESEIKQLYLGLSGEISLPAIPGPTYKGVVAEISNAAGAANAFPVKLTIAADST